MWNAIKIIKRKDNYFLKLDFPRKKTNNIIYFLKSMSEHLLKRYKDVEILNGLCIFKIASQMKKNLKLIFRIYFIHYVLSSPFLLPRQFFIKSYFDIMCP